MRLRLWPANRWPRKRRSAPVPALDVETPPLREFVYLDEISLRSLLASQQGALTESVNELISRAEEAEVKGVVGAGAGLLKSEIQSRFQTSSNTGSQTSRKHIVQSMFKEFRELDGVHLLFEPTRAHEVGSFADLVAAEQGAIAESVIKRGELIEVEVELSAERIFRFSTMISELADMASDYPGMLDASGTAGVLAEVLPINRVLQRMLVGLIPLRARALNLAVVQNAGTSYVVDLSNAHRLNVDVRPLDIVGVTEQANYWKDIRRILFAGATFTMLCRISRTGLQAKWRPVKLTDVLAETVPDFADAIDAVGKAPVGPSVDVSARTGSAAVQTALRNFTDAAARRAEITLTTATSSAVNAFIESVNEAMGPSLSFRWSRILCTDCARGLTRFPLRHTGSGV